MAKSKTKPGTGDALERATAATQATDWGVALAAALEAWHAAPSTLLADAIDKLGARAAAATQPPVGRTPKERNAAWDAAARAGDPVVRHHLVASLTDTKGNTDTLARLQLLERYADPRVTDRILGLIASPIYNASVSRTNNFWKYVFARLATLRDPRIAARIRAFPDGWKKNRSLNEPERVVLRRRLEKLELLEIDDDATPAVRALVTALDAGGSAIALDAGRERDLLAAIYAAPADDGPRIVYADWLLERDDPRGEFINLQLARAADARPSARESELLDLHGARWLGTLAPHVFKTSVRFARGFLVACRVDDNSQDGPAIRPPADPAWATVESVESALPPLAEVAMPALHTALDLDSDAIRYLAALPPARVPPLAHVRIDSEGTRVVAKAFSALKLPRLRRLELRGGRPWSHDPPMTPAALIWKWQKRGLVEFSVTSRLSELAAWRAVATREATLARFELHHGYDWAESTVARLTRDPAGAFSILDIIVSKDGDDAIGSIELVTTALATLPTDALTAVAIELPPKRYFKTKQQRVALDAALARQTALAGPAIIAHRSR